MSCPDCFSGYVREGTTTGTIETIHSRPTYVARPRDGAAPRGILVIVSDAFGWDFSNNRILADSFATKGNFAVYLPDFMNGHSLPTDLIPLTAQVRSEAKGILAKLGKIWTWMKIIRMAVPFLYHNNQTKAFPRVKTWFDALQASNQSSGSPLPVFAAGYCWGGKHAIILCGNADAPAAAVFVGHPSHVKFPADISRVQRPISIAVGSKDDAMKEADVKIARDTLEARKDEIDGEVVVYEGASHGFCVRIDYMNKEQARSAEEAEDQCIRWFEKYVPK